MDRFQGAQHWLTAHWAAWRKESQNWEDKQVQQGPYPVPALLLPSLLSGPGGGSSPTGPVSTHGQRHCMVTAEHTGPPGHMQPPRASRGKPWTQTHRRTT